MINYCSSVDQIQMNAHVYRLRIVVVVRRPSKSWACTRCCCCLLCLLPFVALVLLWCALPFAFWWFACKILHASLWRYLLQPGCSDFRQSLYHRFVRSTYPFHVGINMKSKYPISRAKVHGPAQFQILPPKNDTARRGMQNRSPIAPTTPLSMN